MSEPALERPRWLRAAEQNYEKGFMLHVTRDGARWKHKDGTELDQDLHRVADIENAMPYCIERPKMVLVESGATALALPANEVAKTAGIPYRTLLSAVQSERVDSYSLGRSRMVVVNNRLESFLKAQKEKKNNEEAKAALQAMLSRI